MSMSFEEMQQRALEVRDKYAELEKRNGHEWDASDLMAGFVGDVGDLSKLVMMKTGKRKGDDIDAKLAHELSDCLWSIIVLAKKLGVSLEESFLKTMDELDSRIDGELE